jgi:glycosyltransferase involved in cell wall biosynthesis
MNVCILSSFDDSMQKITGGSVRIYNLAKGLKNNGNSVTVVIPSENTSSEKIDGVTVKSFRGLTPKPILNILRKFLGVVRPTAFYFYDIGFVLRISPLLKKADIIQIEQQAAGALLIPFIKLFIRKPIVMDCHDVFQSIRLKNTGFVRRVLDLCFEQFAYKTAAMLLTVSKNEKNLLVSMGFKKTPIAVIPNGVDTKSYQCLPKIKNENRKSRTIVFVGNLAYFPNREAVKILSTTIAPIVKNKIRNVKFLVVGKKQPGLESDELVFTGFVENLSDLLATSDVAVAPLFHGSGTRLKILEYFSCGLPVVASSVGAEGLEITNGSNIIIEDNPSRFAARIIELLNDPNMSRNLGEAARQLVTTKYDWLIITAKLGQVLADHFGKNKNN